MARPKLAWTTRPFADLVFPDWNPRTIKEPAFKELVRGMKADPDFLSARPVIVSTRTGEAVVVAGNMRARAAKEAGIEPIPCIEGNLTERKEQEWGLLDNMHRGEWDFDKLFAMPADLLKDVGWSDKEIQKLVDGHTEAEEDGYDPDAAKPPARASRGDVWLMGRHKVMCGDSTDAGDVARMMDGKKAGLFLTDPPYGVDYGEKNRSLNKNDGGNRIETDIENDGGGSDKIREIVGSAFKNAFDACSDGACIYSFAPQGGDQMMMMMMMMMMEANWNKKMHQLIWKKNNHVLGRVDYSYIHEPIIYSWKPGGHRFFGGFQTSVLEFDRPQKAKLHPTMKPIELLAKLITNSSETDSTVLDLFLGSGSTLIACEQTGRTCYGMEIDPHYVDVICDRFEKFTGVKPVKLA
jgi:DNA modification methylase